MSDGSTTEQDPRQDPRWRLVRAAARRPVPTPAGLVDRVLRSVRAMRDRVLVEPLEVPQDRGDLRIGGRALVTLCRGAGMELADEYGGVRVLAVSLEPEGFDVLLSVRFGVPADLAADHLSCRLRQRLGALVGVTVPPVNVHVVDVHHP
ncbi:hypothetical protein [Haloechinothrix sp. LS1_15]|uniref:hypothetical protein n=1 Tax=Haloechinothrix sp. LS1_15 TaxID=2652248 RepID=UPI0029480E23|nr:hypothetical protein [Haloechinothrix sp. LS1_15]MDV6011391.1 hypothetical protein [Haloechinothrix sp. LS1_15]